MMMVAATALVAACTGGYEGGSAGGDDAAATASAVRVSGVLFVERTEGSRAGLPVGLGARFARVSGVRDEVLPDLVGTPLFSLPRVGATPSCVERGAADARATESGAEVRLMDVGAIDLVAGERTVRMTPRRFPDLWNVVSGVLYGADSELPMGVLRFSGAGNPAVGVGSFDVSAPAPESLSGVTVNEVAFVSGPDATVTLPRRGGLSLRWARSARAEEGDVVTVAFEGSGQLVCAMRDEGSAELDAATLDRARDVLRDGGTIGLHRLRTRPFTASGVDSATLVFDLAVRAQVPAVAR